MTFPEHLLGCLLLALAALAPLPLAGLVAAALRPRAAGLRLLAGVVAWTMIQSLIVVGLGWCGMLGRPALVAAQVAILAVGMWRWRRSTARGGLVADLAASLRGAAAWPIAERALLAVAATVGVVALLAQPLVPSGNYDTHMYQLPMAAEWLQHGTVQARQAQWEGSATFERGMLHYPGAWNALNALAIALGGHERWALLPSLLAAAMYALAIRALALAAGAARGPALAAAVLALTLPLTAISLHAAHVDLALGAVLLAGLVFALEAGRGGCAVALALALALAGLAPGIKQSGPAAAALIVLTALAALRRRRRRAALVADLRARWPALLPALTVATVLGASWYVRNWIETGNPTGFVRLRLLGIELPGTIDAAYIARTDLRHALRLGDPTHLWLLARVGLFYLGPPAIALLAPLARLPWRWRGRGQAVLGLGLLALALVWMHLASPWSGKHAHDPDLGWWMGQQLRYTFALWGVLGALAALLAPASPRWLGVQAVVAGLSACALPFFALPTAWSSAVVASALTLILALRWRWRPRWALVPLGVLLAVAPWALAPWRQAQRDAWFWGAPSALAALPEAAPIAFWGSHQSWLLYGERARRPVRHVDASRCRDYAELRAAVLATGCDHLAIGETWPPSPAAPTEWIAAHPEDFALVHGDAGRWGMKIWRVLR